MLRLRAFLHSYQTGVILIALLLLVIVLYKTFNHFFVYERDAFIESNLIQITPVVSGPVEEIFVADLQKVRQGQLLFRIDQKPFIDKLNQAKANLQLAKNNHQSLLEQLTTAETKLQVAQDELSYQNKELKRYQTLSEANDASLQKRDQSLFYQQQAQGAVETAKLAIKTIKAQLGPTDQEFAQTAKAKAELKLASYLYNHTNVYSPIDGRITAFFLRKGDYANEGSPLFAIVNEEQWWVDAKIKEGHLNGILGNRATIWLGTGETFEGKVSGIAWAVNRKEKGGAENFSVLPYLKKTEYWIDLPQRFPVRIDFEAKGHELHYGTSAKVLIHK
jgi:multidrug resistance efflux pump